MSFLHGDIVWVPQGSSSNDYWPAKVFLSLFEFLKQTNRTDLCMVWLYDANKDEQFIVDTQEILRFEDFSPPEGMPDSLKRAYEAAIIDQNSKCCTEYEENLLKNSQDFCDFIDKLMISNYMEIGSIHSNEKIIVTPKFIDNTLPLNPDDLRLYFQRKIPQMMAYLIEAETGNKHPQLIEFMKEAKDKIIKEITICLRKKSIKLGAF